MKTIVMVILSVLSMRALAGCPDGPVVTLAGDNTVFNYLIAGDVNLKTGVISSFAGDGVAVKITSVQLLIENANPGTTDLTGKIVTKFRTEEACLEWNELGSECLKMKPVQNATVLFGYQKQMEAGYENGIKIAEGITVDSNINVKYCSIVK